MKPARRSVDQWDMRELVPPTLPTSFARLTGSADTSILRRLSVRSRVFALAAVAVALVVFTAAMHISTEWRLDRKLHGVFEVLVPLVDALDRAEVGLMEQQAIVDRAVRSLDLSYTDQLPDEFRRYRAAFDRSVLRTQTAFEHARDLQQRSQDATFETPAAIDYDRMQHRTRRLQMLQNRVFRLAAEGEHLRARRLNHALERRQRAVTQSLDTPARQGHEQIDAVRGQVAEMLRKAAYQDLILAAIACVIMVLLALSIARSITGPLGVVMHVAARLTAGQRKINGPTDRSLDEVGELLRTLYHLDQAVTAAEDDMERRAEDLALTNDRLESQAMELANKTQELELARRQADAANLAKSQFLANMSHEIRTPMTAILGYADLMRDPSLTGPHRREHLDTIRRNGEHLLVILNDILDVSKIEAGQMTVERIETRPLLLLEQSLDLLKVRAQETEISLTLEPVFPLPETIASDPVRFRQVILNLVGNAVKFSPHGTVTVRPSFDAEQQRLAIEITDNGIGMNDEQVAALFRPFTQADDSTTRKFGGTGLGLTISKRLAEMLGGDITVSSQPQRGSTFTVTFATGPVPEAALLHEMPVAPVSAPTARAAATDGSAPLAGRILLAEDGPDNQRLITFILKKAGLTVDLAVDGQQALDFLNEARERDLVYDLILMDMQMPRVDGLTATRSARALGYAGPIIALTAHAMDEQRREALAAGCSAFATKPIDRQALLALIAQHLGQAAGADDADSGSAVNPDGRAAA
ncbi:MAG: ATP-binding protein [Planctomycetota bacterium]